MPAIDSGVNTIIAPLVHYILFKVETVKVDQTYRKECLKITLIVFVQ